jgi:hypothetical protein
MRNIEAKDMAVMCNTHMIFPVTAGANTGIVTQLVSVAHDYIKRHREIVMLLWR